MVTTFVDNEICDEFIGAEGECFVCGANAAKSES